MTLDLAAVWAEVTTDPGQLGCAALLAEGRDNALADLLNAPQDGADYTVDLDGLPVPVIAAAIVRADYTALAPGDAAWLALVLRGQTVSDTTIADILTLFSKTATGTALAAIATRQMGRAEKLFGQVIGESDIAAARNADPTIMAQVQAETDAEVARVDALSDADLLVYRGVPADLAAALVTAQNAVVVTVKTGS